MATTPLKRVMQAATRLHVALYRLSRGKFAGTMANLPVLLITPSGRISGKPYTNPVVYIRDGPDYLVSATAGGVDWDPGWYLNLKVRPQATIELGNTAFHVEAQITASEERARLYERFKATSSNFGKYERKTSRVLPVIRLILT